MNAYFIPAQSVCFEQEIKKSRFMTFLAPADGVDTAKRFIEQTKRAHPSARHHCWAFIAGAPNDAHALGFSDDGEPTGTAGKPMLGQLMGSSMGEIVAVTVRYYGGVLLGTGGLVKAYGNGVQQALKRVPRHLKRAQSRYRLVCEYPQLPMVEMLLSNLGGSIINASYAAKIDVILSLPTSHSVIFKEKLRNISRGTLILSPIE